MRLALLGPQGAGKGTQAERIAALIGGQHISTGDLVRAEIHAGTPLGLQIKGYNDRGDLVPLDIIVSMTRAHLQGVHAWILDGFPRNQDQARAFDEAMREVGEGLDRVIALVAPDDLLVERLSGRRQSEATGHIYHVLYNPPPPDDPGPFIQRDDDTPQAIRHRLEIYHTETEPLKRYYAQRGLLVEIDASGEIATVTQAIMHALAVGPGAERLLIPAEPATDRPVPLLSATQGNASGDGARNRAANGHRQPDAAGVAQG